MFGYPRRGAEIWPSVRDGVAPMNPTPSTSHQGGIHNGRLQHAHACHIRMSTCRLKEACAVLTKYYNLNVYYTMLVQFLKSVDPKQVLLTEFGQLDDL